MPIANLRFARKFGSQFVVVMLSNRKFNRQLAIGNDIASLDVADHDEVANECAAREGEPAPVLAKGEVEDLAGVEVGQLSRGAPVERQPPHV